MLHDCRGLSVTSDNAFAVAAYDKAVHAFLTQSGAVEAFIASALSADPGFLLPHGLRGFLALLSARRIADPIAEASRRAVAASLAERGGTTRERRVAAALDRLAERRAVGALVLLDELLAADPLDAMAVKLAHTIRFQVGLAEEMRRSIEAAALAWGDEVPGYGYVLGCRSFASGETGDLVGAARYGRAALARCPDDRWGAHAVAHVFEMRGEAAQGVDWLDDVLAADPSIDGFNRHLGWHRALALIGLDRLDQALDAFDRQVWSQSWLEYRDLANAVSLLRRVEMAGGAVGDRWERVCDASASLLDDRRLAFSDAHALIGLMRAGRVGVAQRALARLEDMASKDDLSPAHYPEGSLALLRGLLSQDPDSVATALPRLDRIGGSVVQRDLLLRSAVETLVETNRTSRAADILAERAQRFAPCRWSKTVERRIASLVRSGVQQPAAA
jgi:tetratricopeptide (TPR) repeat protein